MTGDEFADAIADNIAKGYIEVVGFNDDGPMYRLTDAGVDHVLSLQSQLADEPEEDGDG